MALVVPEVLADTALSVPPPTRVRTERCRESRRVSEPEAGIPPRAVELIGRIDDLVTNSGFLVAPFVGVVHERIEYVMQESEVAEVFEVPIDALLDVRYPEVRYVTFRKKRYPAYFYPYDEYDIWGLTGRIVKSFLDLVWQSI